MSDNAYDNVRQRRRGGNATLAPTWPNHRLAESVDVLRIQTAVLADVESRRTGVRRAVLDDADHDQIRNAVNLLRGSGPSTPDIDGMIAALGALDAWQSAVFPFGQQARSGCIGEAIDALRLITPSMLRRRTFFVSWGDESAVASPVRTPVAQDLRADVWDKTGGHCWYCGVLMHPLRNFHVDHVIPVIDGGPSDIANLTPACQSCNNRKGSRPAEYLRRFFADGLFWSERRAPP